MGIQRSTSFKYEGANIIVIKPSPGVFNLTPYLLIWNLFYVLIDCALSWYDLKDIEVAQGSTFWFIHDNPIIFVVTVSTCYA
jgi:hypothetical protein